MFLTSHFSGKQEKFDNLADFDSDEEEKNVEITEDDLDEADVFYPWECVSFVRKNGFTLDLKISSASDMLALIHIVHRHIFKFTDSNFLYIYKVLKFKMKLAYESWIKRISLSELIQRAIFKTLVQ